MTPPNHDAINFCEDCELEYAAHRCAPCPLCPLRIQRQKAWNALHDCELYRVIENSSFWRFQDTLNEMTAAGWNVMNIRIGHSTNDDGGDPVYVAVFQREHYDRARHAQAIATEKQVSAGHRMKRVEIEAETQAFRAARNGEAAS